MEHTVATESLIGGHIIIFLITTLQYTIFSSQLQLEHISNQICTLYPVDEI